MHPQLPAGRLTTARLTVLSLLVGAALAAAPAAPAAGAEGAPRYERLPVLERDWSRLGVGPDGVDPVAAEERRQAVLDRRWREVHELVGGQHVSRRSRELLRRRGLGPALLAGDPAKAAAFDGIDTLKVLLVRISFETNRDPHLTTIPPDGDFMLTPDPVPEPIPVDPAPHDRTYFEAHLRGLSEYYRYQSGGRLQIEGRVLPDADRGSYKLGDIADYGPGTSGFWSLESLERLVRDMMVAADAGAPADGVDLGDYDDDSPFTYVIFVHAGSDWQSDINVDSPNDIPTFFISLGEPQALANGQLSECSIIPETTSQDGGEGSIAAALYHEFGHALGLPDVYSTATAYPLVGIWDLMDSGTNLPVLLGTITDEGDTLRKVAVGVLPPSLSAWNRWFLGWLEVDEATNRTGDTYLPAACVPRDQYALYRTVNPAFRDNYPQALRAGVSPREWFLAENRWVPGGPAETPYESLYFERDEVSGVIEYLAGLRLGVWENTGLYDYFMPAGGVLVWHVNMDRIEGGLADNTINWYEDGLRLVEADGIQDVGVTDGYVLGWYGSALDPFGGYEYDENGDRAENGFRVLHREGFPSSRCYDRSWTGVELADVRMNGFNGGVMRFTARLDGVARGFPWETAPVDSAEAAALAGSGGARALDPRSLTPLLVGGLPVMIFADAAPAGWSGGSWPTGLNGLDNTGSPRWGAPAGRPFSEFARLSAPLAGAPAAWNEPDGTARLLCGTVDGRVSFFTIPAAGQPTLTWAVDVGDSLGGAPRVLAGAGGPAVVFCPVLPDQVVRLDLAVGAPTGAVTVLQEGQAGPAFRGESRVASGPGGDELVLFQDDRILRVADAPGGPQLAGQAAYPRAAQGALHTLAAADAAMPRLAVFDDLGLVGAWLPDGTPAPATDPGTPLVAEPAVADLDGDGRQDLVLVTAERVFAARPDGVALRGFPAPLADMFPLPDSTRLAGPLVVADADGDGLNEIFTGTDGGHLLGLTATGDLRARFPFRWGDRAASGFAVGEARTDTTGRLLWLMSAGGYAGEPLDRQLTGGRLTGLQLAATAAAGARTSEWLAAGGGPGRRGPVGEAGDLGGVSPTAAESGRIVLYPSPVTGDDVTVRFTGPVDGTARLTFYTLEGEPLADASFAVTGGIVTEHTVALPGVAPGLYVCRLQWPTAGGRETRTMTMAVER